MRFCRSFSENPEILPNISAKKKQTKQLWVPNYHPWSWLLNFSDLTIYHHWPHCCVLLILCTIEAFNLGILLNKQSLLLTKLLTKIMTKYWKKKRQNTENSDVTVTFYQLKVEWKTESKRSPKSPRRSFRWLGVSKQDIVLRLNTGKLFNHYNLCLSAGNDM